MTEPATQTAVKIYSTPWCPYCIRAKNLLQNKGIPFQDTDVSYEPELRRKLQQLTGRTSVPQIFINGKSIGGCDELYALEAAGQLESMLKAS